ncbi:cob(I)yrinic acid a,c-diamide adenosyltransferase [Hyphomicrobiales bacterium]|nr:cob(I)yrinic acid a,c-diamide adenosyltransferase [Hyphomicrobiales bacterium]MDC0140001.1 cob(I)yrinic acid a,c-diamide adenosyltransferase [Hyphomicrobiales bacterium]MDC3272468.1 cob(I)yrinic acid a,c-diamide adenosyltransferase [Hyphomicrobiales bacterium]
MVRLNKIYTRTGDDGTTSLGSGDRERKDSPRISAYGSVDETNSFIGTSRQYIITKELKELDTILFRVQNDLFDLGADLCVPENNEQDSKNCLRINNEQVIRLEKEIDLLNAELLPLKSFILPGGSKASSYLHIARTVSRRAEREMITVNQVEIKKIGSPALKYINRLSDLLFVASRYANLKLNKDDILWVPGANR